MATNDLVHYSESMQYFPDSLYERIPSFTMRDDTYLEEERAKNEIDVHITGALLECLEEIDVKGKELFKKIVSNTHVEIPLGKLAREAIGDSRAKDFLEKMVTKVSFKMKAEKDEDFVAAKRDLSVDDELSKTLERFKVKTVNIGVVVKENH